MRCVRLQHAGAQAAVPARERAGAVECAPRPDRAAALVRAGDGGLTELLIETESVLFSNVYKKKCIA